MKISVAYLKGSEWTEFPDVKPNVQSFILLFAHLGMFLEKSMLFRWLSISSEIFPAVVFQLSPWHLPVMKQDR